MRNDLQLIRQRYSDITELSNDRCVKLEKVIQDIKQYQDEFSKTDLWLGRLESLIVNENVTAFGDTRQMQTQIEQCKIVRKDLDSIRSATDKLNDYVRHLQLAASVSSQANDTKFLNKLKSDMHELNDKLTHLNDINMKQQVALQVFSFVTVGYLQWDPTGLFLLALKDACHKTSKIDEEIDELDAWMQRKERELLHDESTLILSEEQLTEKYNRYRDLKYEVEHKELVIKHIINTGNIMLKNSTVSNAADLARNMLNINTKWATFCKSADAKYRYFHEIQESYNELKREYRLLTPSKSKFFHLFRSQNV